MKKKSIVPWVIYLVLPLPLLFFTAFIQTIVRALISQDGSNTSIVVTVVNILSLIAGLVAVIMLVLFPLWIIRLIKTINYNNSISEKPGTSHQNNAPAQEKTSNSESLPPSKNTAS